jgi:hypothetical protein
MSARNDYFDNSQRLSQNVEGLFYTTGDLHASILLKILAMGNVQIDRGLVTPVGQAFADVRRGNKTAS